jgi:hypothetical protein
MRRDPSPTPHPGFGKEIAGHTFVAPFFIPLFHVWAESGSRWLRAKFTGGAAAADSVHN